MPDSTDPLAVDKLPIDALAQMDYDQSVTFLGVLPVAAVIIVALIYAVLYFFRRGKTWNELGEAMRYDPTQSPPNATQSPSGESPGDYGSGFKTSDLSSESSHHQSEPEEAFKRRVS